MWKASDSSSWWPNPYRGRWRETSFSWQGRGRRFHPFLPASLLELVHLISSCFTLGLGFTHQLPWLAGLQTWTKLYQVLSCVSASVNAWAYSSYKSLLICILLVRFLWRILTNRAVIAFIVVGVTELCRQLIPMATGESLSGLNNFVNHCNAAPMILECRTPFPSSSCNPATHKPKTSLSLPFFLSCSQSPDY